MTQHWFGPAVVNADLSMCVKNIRCARDDERSGSSNIMASATSPFTLCTALELFSPLRNGSGLQTRRAATTHHFGGTPARDDDPDIGRKLPNQLGDGDLLVLGQTVPIVEHQYCCA